MVKRNIKLVLEYDGTRYHGFQVQPGQPTVQGELEAALFRLLQQETRVKAAGRTDAGVHALGQVVNFYTCSPLPAEVFLKALNALMPRDIAVKEAEDVPLDFDARRSAKGKIYVYTIHNQEPRPALDYQRCWHVRRPLDLTAMKKAAEHLIGRHDFSAFRSSSCEARSPVREVRRIEIAQPQPGRVLVEVEADAFLKQMVRAIVGTLVEVGLGRRAPDDVLRILESKDRTKAGGTAPACGLCLRRVNY